MALVTNGSEHLSFEEQMRITICEALRVTSGKVSGKGGAAKLLQLNAKTLSSKIRKLGIDVRRF